MTKPDTRSPVSFEAWFQSQNPSLPLQGARAVLELSAGGSTLPFIARYRKEATGNLDEVAIGLILDAKETYDQLRERQVYVLGEIEKQGKLTDALKAEIESCFHKQKLEDLYLPFKQKRKSKASKAREAGLEPLANWLWEVAHGVIQPEPGQTLELWALTFRNEPMGYADVDAVLEGAGDILIERLSENAVLRERIRAMVFNEAFLRTEKGAKVKPNSKFEPYFDYQEKIQSLLEPSSSHRYLAIRRGWIEEELKLDVTGGKEDPAFEERLLSVFEDETAANADSALEEKGKALLKRCARLALKAHVLPSIENEAHAALKSASDEIAIHVFSENVRKLLLASPFGPKSVLGVDPGVRTGCKCAWIDQTGKYLASFVMQLQTDEGKADAKEKLSQLSGLDQIRCIAVGNGTAGRETEIFVRQTLQELGAQIPVVMVNEAGASVYSASETARAEFPDLDVTVRGAISIGRRLQDPLAELVKIDPKSIGVGQYQHDVSQPALKRSLERVVDSCVNSVGVNLNTASEYVLARVSGIGEGLAKAIVSHRAEKGLFEARRSLLDVPRFSQKVFEQAAGFLRVPESGNPLDATGVHPEQYAVLEEFVASQGKTVKDVVGPGVALVRESKELREKLGEFSFADIVKELERPGRDPRDVFVPFQYRADIHALADLKPEMLCPGIVTNVTTFGAFVDIGVHQDGLVHISQLANQFVKDPSQVVSPGDRVQVKVLEVNLEKKQISLSMKLGEPAQAGARGGRGKSSARSAEEDSGSGQPRRKPSFQRADEATSAGAGSGDSRFGGGSGGERGGRRGPGSRDGGRGAGRGGRDERLNEVSVPAARDYGDRGPARTSGFAGGRGGSSGAAGRGGASGGFGGRGASGGGRERGGSPEKRSSASGASAGSRASGGAGASRGAGAGMRSEPKKDQPAFNNPFAALASLKKPQ